MELLNTVPKETLIQVKDSSGTNRWLRLSKARLNFARKILHSSGKKIFGQRKPRLTCARKMERSRLFKTLYARRKILSSVLDLTVSQ